MKRASAAVLFFAALAAAEPPPASFNAMTTVVPRKVGGPKLKGTVVSADGPVAGARVISIQANPGVLSRQNLADLRTCPLTTTRIQQMLEGHQQESIVFGRTITGADGRFEVDAVGNAAVWVDAAGYGSKLVVVGNVAEVGALQVGLAPGTYRTGTVVDEAQRPIAAAIVTAVHPDGRYFDAMTNDAGVYALGPFEASVDAVFARRAGYVPRSVQPGTDPIVLPHPRSLKVTVRNDEGPLARTPVVLGTAPCTSLVMTDANGAAELPNVPPGVWALSTGQSLFGAQRVVAVGGDARERSIAPLVVLPSAGLQIDVAGLPREGAAVTATLFCGGDVDGVAVPGLPNQRGRMFLGLLPQGECLVEFESAALAAPQVRKVTLTAGQTAVLRAELPIPKTFFLHVGTVDAKNKPFDRATIHYARPGEPESHRPSPLEITEGTWDIWATADGLVSETMTISSVNAQVRPSPVLKLEPAPRVRGKVQELGGAKVAAAEVSVHCGPGDAVTAALTGPNGDFELTPEATGNCVLRVTRASPGLTFVHEQPLRLAVKAKVQAPVRVTPVVKTRGTIEGAPSATMLHFTSGLSQAEAAVTDGTFEVMLTAGAWTLWSAGPGLKVAAGEVVAGQPAALKVVPAPEPVPAADAGIAVADAGRPLSVEPTWIAGARVLGPDGRPVAGARLEPWTAGQKVFGCRHPDALPTDGKGRGWLEVRKGQAVLAGAPGFIPALVTVAFDGGTPEIRLKAGSARLEGEVVRDAGSPVGVELCLEGPSGQLAFTRGDGKFAFEDLPPGSYVLTARTLGRVGHAQTSVKVDVQPGMKPVKLGL